MFALHVSHNCGMSYHREVEAEKLDELRPRMAELDKGMLRWYLTKDGEDYWEEACGIHKGILQSMAQANKGLHPTAAGVESVGENSESGGG